MITTTENAFSSVIEALVLVSNAVGLGFSTVLLFYPMHTELHEAQELGSDFRAQVFCASPQGSHESHTVVLSPKVEWTPAGIAWSIASCIGGGWKNIGLRE